MAERKKHEPPEAIEAYLEECLEFAHRLCLHYDVNYRAGGLRLLRELFRAHRSGRMTPAQERKIRGAPQVSAASYPVDGPGGADDPDRGDCQGAPGPRREPGAVGLTRLVSCRGLIA
jgi:hypothetical protein